MNKWKNFADLNNMTPEQFSDEIIECSQAILAMHLIKEGGDKVTITNAQNDGVYELTFKRIVK